MSGSLDWKELPERKWNPNMNWQNEWETRCPRICCYARGCADLKCATCLKSVVRPLEAPRYACLDCEVHSDTEEMNDLCSSCFESISAPHFGSGGHPHLRWVKVDVDGTHSTATRSVMEGVQCVEVSLADLAVSGQGCCPVCFDDAQLYLLPQCNVDQHGLCEDCCFGTLKHNHRDKYVAGALPPVAYFCASCQIEKEKAREVQDVLEEVKRALAGLPEGDYVSAEDARSAVENAHSLAGRGFANDARACSHSELLHLLVDCMKQVHAGAKNVHIQEALDFLLV